MADSEVGAGRDEMLMASPGFVDWLGSVGVSLALTTYQRGRLVFIGRRPDGTLRAHERQIDQSQGLWTDGQSLWVSSLWSLIRFENALRPGAITGRGADRLFAPRETRITGRIDVHDIAVTTADGPLHPIFVNTAFNCLATVDDQASFRPIWRPHFVSDLIGEDRCHLNGLTLRGGVPGFVTAISRSDVADGWRDRRSDGGVVVDVASNEVVAAGLSMPHSPRWHDGRLWMLESGTGTFGVVDLTTGKLDPVAFCPGYARGLAFADKYAVIGLSRPRNNNTFTGLALDEALTRRDAEARCGVIIIDLETGQTVAWLRFNHTIDELYDVAVLSGVRQAEAIGFRGDAIARHVTLPK